MARIVHLTSVHPATDTRIFHRECASLVAAGHDVTLIATADVAEPTHSDCAGIHLQLLPRQRGRLGRMATTARSVVQAGAALNADLYHLHDPELLIWAPMLRMRGKRVLFDMHEFLPGAIKDKKWIWKPLRPVVEGVARLGERLLLQGLPVIFAEDSYRKHYAWVKQWAAVRNFPDLERLAGYRAAPGAKFTIGYLGGVSVVRGSENMLRAVALLQQQGRQVIFECIGPASPAHMERLKGLVQELDIDDVNLRGRMSQPDALPIVARCNVGLAVLQDRPNYRDSYPTKMFEYMALGIPVIVSDFPLYRAVVQNAECGICVPPDDPVALAEAIATLQDNPVLAVEMGERGIAATVTFYNWQNEASKLLTLYGEVLLAIPSTHLSAKLKR